MAGKMTVLDRLVLQGKIKPSSSRDLRVRGEFFDPLQYTTQQRILMQGAPERAYMAVPQNGVGRDIKLTPERQVYQKGIEARMSPKDFSAWLDEERASDKLNAYREEWREAVNDAKENVMTYQDPDAYPELYEDANPEYPEVELPSSELRKYWPEYARSPEKIYNSYRRAEKRYVDAKNKLDYLRSPAAWMEEQTMTPRYRNYQRLMQQREANKRMGHQLSRMWGDAYNRLRARGLSDDEARMYLHSYFGGR